MEKTKGNRVVRELLARRGMTMRYVSHVAGISQGYVSLLLRGRKPLTVDCADRLAAALGISRGQLRREVRRAHGAEAERRAA